MPRSGAKPTAVYLEVGRKRVFAAAVDWPGWCRSGKTEELALEALADYYDRYRTVSGRARIAFPKRLVAEFEVMERLPGTATTDFGAPGEIAEGDTQRLTAADARRVAALVRAAWAELAEIAAGSPEQLRKGPRGGGRDRDPMVAHVINAEAAYARKLGIKHKPPDVDDSAAIGALRDAILEVLGSASDGTPLVPGGWPPRYAARRIAWHVLDHAWEMQDRRELS
jgi:hypothetical protein